MDIFESAWSVQFTCASRSEIFEVCASNSLLIVMKKLSYFQGKKILQEFFVGPFCYFFQFQIKLNFLFQKLKIFKWNENCYFIYKECGTLKK